MRRQYLVEERMKAAKMPVASTRPGRVRSRKARGGFAEAEVGYADRPDHPTRT